MCVMSLSVMPYHSDRSHIVSVTMTGAPTEKGEAGKRGVSWSYTRRKGARREDLL